MPKEHSSERIKRQYPRAMPGRRLSFSELKTSVNNPEIPINQQILEFLESRGIGVIECTFNRDKNLVVIKTADTTDTNLATNLLKDSQHFFEIKSAWPKIHIETKK
jgi:hypothetical protein